MPEPMREGRLGSPEAREEALVKKPQIGDTMPVPNVPPPGPANGPSEEAESSPSSNRSGQKRRRKSGGQKGQQQKKQDSESASGKGASSGSSSKGRSSSRRRRRSGQLSAEARDQRRGRERNGRPIGRYFMCVQVREGITQVAVLEGRNLIEHYVSRPADDVSQIHGNIYLGRVQNVLPGMEAAFVDIATPKNAVLYRGDVQYDSEDIESDGNDPRIEQILKNRQTILCQVTKNPIGAKGARLTQEVSLPGRFVVLIPNSTTYGISKRLPDQVRRRLRSILDKVKPEGHGLIVRTAAEHATEAELTADMRMLLEQWDRIEAQAKGLKKPTLLHREPELAVRV
ncbi:MAG: ribonuclease E/G, partial [Actinomycetota bacterium]|nr:ribonuclease E/G [Actinomycetota bacterium]